MAEHLLVNGLNIEFRAKAKEIASSVEIDNLNSLYRFFHNPPSKPHFYTVEEYGLGGWLSACQFAIFEIIYNLGEDTLPFIREIAWGEYDWIQGNAIELLIRFAAQGIRTEELIVEIKENFPNIRCEAQLYAIQPLVKDLATDLSLSRVFDRLLEIEDFQDAYDEITYVDPDPHNIFNDNLYGRVVSSSKTDEKIYKKKTVAFLNLNNFQYGAFARKKGEVRVGINEDCQIFKLEGKEVLSATLDEILKAQIVAVGHWSFEQTNTNPISIYPRAITKIQ
ncbi:MAG: hypothetical protein AAGF83_26065 [Cyanobacteria bacterium P01_G01_bin.67]